MKIKQEDNGNILITRDNGEIAHILPSIYVHQHPRKANAILITSSALATHENQGISILASKITSIGDEGFSGDVNSLKQTLSKRIIVSGIVPQLNAVPLTKENDPNYVGFLQANTFEKLLTFAKENKSNVGGVTIRQGKIVGERFLCQFETFIIEIELFYLYSTSNPDLIDYIEMQGNTEYVFEAKKVYQYDSNDNIIGFNYEKII